MDPTPSYKDRLVSRLRSWTREGTLSKQTKYQIYPTSEIVPKIYGTPKIHKENYPLRPIVSCIGSITYNASKLLAAILNPLVGNTLHHVKNSQDFADKISRIYVTPGQKMISYDVSALFTSIPVSEALEAVKEKLEVWDKLH